MYDIYFYIIVFTVNFDLSHHCIIGCLAYPNLGPVFMRFNKLFKLGDKMYVVAYTYYIYII